MVPASRIGRVQPAAGLTWRSHASKSGAAARPSSCRLMSGERRHSDSCSGDGTANAAAGAAPEAVASGATVSVEVTGSPWWEIR
jgi:hypothetical protein